MATRDHCRKGSFGADTAYLTCLWFLKLWRRTAQSKTVIT